MNTPYTKEIYDKKLLQQIKKIRQKIYGELEDNIPIEMIPIAYEKYGLLWRPATITDADLGGVLPE